MKLNPINSLVALTLITATPAVFAADTWAADKAGKATHASKADKATNTAKSTRHARALARQATTQGAGKQRAGQANFGNLISALNNVNVQAQNIQALNNINAVDVVDVNNVLNGTRVNALNNAINRNNVQVLQDAIKNNEVVKNALNDLNINIGDVVAVNVLSGGDLVVFSR